MALVAKAVALDPNLSPVGAGLLVALQQGICTDSRSFARILGIEHALVLREVTSLAERELLHVISRNARTQRTELLLTPEGKRIARTAASAS